MKKTLSNLRILLVVALLVTLPLAVYSMEVEYEEINILDFQMETKINLTTVESQAVSASAFGGDISLYDSEQIDSHFNITKICMSDDINADMAVSYIGYKMESEAINNAMFFGGDQLLNAVVA